MVRRLCAYAIYQNPDRSIKSSYLFCICVKNHNFAVLQHYLKTKVIELLR